MDYQIIARGTCAARQLSLYWIVRRDADGVLYFQEPAMVADAHQTNNKRWGARIARRRISLVLALVLLTTLGLSAPGVALAAGGSAAEAGTALAVVRISGATLHDAAGVPLRELPANMRLTVHGRSADGGWLQVSAPGGVTGWVRKEQVVAFGLGNLPVMADFQEPAGLAEASADAAVPTTQQTATVNTTGGHLNVRSGPGTTYPVIARLADGQSVPALARNQTGDWVQIARPAPADGFGWVSGGLVTLDGAAGDLPVSEAISDAPVLPAAATTQLAQPARAGGNLPGTIVFQERSGGAIYAYDPASGGTRQIATGADPAISPDGRQVAFWRDEAGQHALFTVNIDGSGEQRLLTRGEMIRAPS
ncbi:MAG: SH3 domain-containing protein [Caldilineales bacterium]